MSKKGVFIALGLIIFVFLIGAGVLLITKNKEAKVVIADGRRVSIEYSLYLEDGTLIDSNVDKEPLVYEQGANQVIPGLESRLEGLEAGEEKKVEVPPNEGYGLIDANAFQEVDKDRIPADALKAGTMLEARDETGRAIPVRVHEIKESTVVLDFNHPLAGEKLFFDVKILKIE